MMPICLPCVPKHRLTDKPIESRKNQKIIGWQGICDKCKTSTIVYSSQEVGVNPEIRKDVRKL